MYKDWWVETADGITDFLRYLWVDSWVDAFNLITFNFPAF